MKTPQNPLQSMVHGSFAFLLALVIFSCGSKSELASHIPKDANVVLAVDVKSIGLKSLDFKEIISLDNIKKAFGSASEKDSIGNALKNSGIDLMNKAYFFMNIADSSKYGAAVAALSDAKKFEDFLKQSNSDFVITEEGNFKLASLPNEKSIIAWSASEVILLFEGETPKETILSLANLKKEESLASASETFSDLEKESADISVWASFENLGKLAPQYGVATPGMSFKDTYMTATCNFEDGQVVINSKYTGNKETAGKFDFIKANVSSEVAGALPGKTVVALFGFAMDMEKVYNYLEQEKLVEAYGAPATQMTGLTVKEFLTMLSGDLAVTVNGVEMKEVPGVDWTTGQVVTKKEPQPDYCAVIGIADKDRASKLLTQFSESGMLTKNADHYSFQNKVFIIEKGSSLIVTGTESMKQAILDGSGEKLNAELSGLLTANASSFYLNLNNIPETVFAPGNPVFGNSIKDLALEDVTFTGSTLQGNVSTGKIVFRFKDKGENSLITLSRMSKKFSERMKEASVEASAKTEEAEASN